MGLDIEKYKKRLLESQERSSGGGGDMTFFNIKEGRNVVRILPPKVEDGDIYSECKINYNLGPNKDRQAVSRKSAGFADDPVEELIQELESSGDKDDAKYAKKLKPRMRYYFNVINREATEGDDDFEKVLVMGCGTTVFEGVLGLIVDPDFGDITDPEEGYDVIITRKGKGMKTEYKVTGRPKQTPIGVDDWEEQLHDLEKLTKPRDAEAIEHLLETGEWPARSGDDDEDDDEKPKKKKKKAEEKKKKTTTKKKKKPEPVDEEEEEEDDDDFEDDDLEEDEIEDLDDEDEDLDDEDEDEDEDADEDEDEDEDADEDEDEDDDIEAEIEKMLAEDKKKAKKKKK
ncbi:single strand DNA binding protein [Bacillus phage SP-10]|uniref:single strand DNA binding protein n=1 Tax=Bacillus phage SP10 TaxID=941058 RepID=UPI0002198B96|nr:single strand DNA binding protein [Bacillus phage SP-10]BAK53006.1 hypothetical protein [Bacillus phage SP-10]